MVRTMPQAVQTSQIWRLATLGRWRKTSFGTDSAAGSRFVERILTAVESCRHQDRNLLDFLVQAVSAHRSIPSGA